MPVLTTALRRGLLLMVLGACVAAVVNSRRQRSNAARSTEPPVWPEFPDLSVVPPTTTSTTTPTSRSDRAPNGEDSRWVPGTDTGSIPAGYPVKVKESSGIFHVPGGRFYERTTADRHYASAEAAEADGYRQSKA